MMNDLSAFQRDILFLVAGLESPSIYDLNQQMEEYRDSGVTIERVEPNVRSLKDKGLITENPDSGRYRITRTGLTKILARRKFEDELLQNIAESSH